MRRIYLLILMAVMTTTAFAQYTKVSCARFPKAMDIVQIDYRESSTIVFLKYICQEGVTWSTYSGAYPFSIPGLQSAVRSAKIGSF